VVETAPVVVPSVERAETEAVVETAPVVVPSVERAETESVVETAPLVVPPVLPPEVVETAPVVVPPVLPPAPKVVPPEVIETAPVVVPSVERAETPPAVVPDVAAPLSAAVPATAQDLATDSLTDPNHPDYVSFLDPDLAAPVISRTVTSNAIALSWVEWNQKHPVAGYIVEVGAADGAESITMEASTSFAFPGLALPDTSYPFSVTPYKVKADGTRVMGASRSFEERTLPVVVATIPPIADGPVAEANEIPEALPTQPTLEVQTPTSLLSMLRDLLLRVLAQLFG